MKAVIMAGGRGTRLATVTSGIPKPMIKIDNIPVLEHEIMCLREQGIEDIIITVGFMHEKIIEYFGDGSQVSPVTGKPYGVHIEYYVEKEPLGNAGALFRIKEKLKEDFLLINADAMFDIDFERFILFHKSKGGLVSIFTHPNDHPYDSAIIIADEDGRVKQWITKEDIHPQFYRNRVNAGVHIVNPQILYNNVLEGKVDLDRQVLKPLVETGKIYCYDSPEYVKDLGTPERFNEVCKDYYCGKIKARNLKLKQKAVFLDRDGTINKYVGFLHTPDEFELIEGAASAIRTINKLGYLAIVVTNQPVVARGETSIEELNDIHNKMETLLGREGAYVDAIYYCPHHPDAGYKGEIPELKIKCKCRKPNPGMLLKAAREFNLDLHESWMIGDQKSDVEAGIAAGCRTALISNEEVDFGQDFCVSSLAEFATSFSNLKDGD